MAFISWQNQMWYRNNIRKQADAASNFVKNYTKNLINSPKDLSIADIRNESIKVIDAATQFYGNGAKAVSNEIFNSVMIQDGSKIRGEYLEDDIDLDMIEGRVRYLIGLIVEGEQDAFVEEMGKYSNYLIWRRGFLSGINNGKYYGLRYARVPMGVKTCAFCLMLASRGFVYHSAEKAGAGFNAYHNRCDCDVICESDKDTCEVEGYDWRKYKAIYDYARYKAEQGFEGTGQQLENATLEEIRKYLKIVENGKI